MSAVRFFRWCILLHVLNGAQTFCFSNRTNNDPYPVYTALYPYTFLTTNVRDYYIGEVANRCQERFTFSISPFRQSASMGRDIQGRHAQLGDLRGPWNMIALFYPGSNGSTAVQQALQAALGITQADLNTVCTTNQNAPTFGDMFTPTRADVTQQFGFFSVPIQYRKWGVRLEAECYLGANFGFKVEAGVSDLIQTASFYDLTCGATGRQCAIACSDPTTPCCDIDQIGCSCKRLLMLKVMDQLDVIARTLNLNIKNFNHRGMEDMILSLYWRRVFPVNQEREDWPYFLLMPFFALEFCVPTGERVGPNCLFAIPNGNNRHAGVGFSAGFNFDFAETIEIGIQASMTEYFHKCYADIPVPVSTFQSGMFPYKANLRMKPGTNWTFSALIHAHHFLDRLSIYAQWVAINHNKDHFSDVVVKPFAPGETPPAALIGKMSNESQWHVQVVNVGATYDISPNIALGLLWQAPTSRKNAYRSTTILGSIIFTW